MKENTKNALKMKKNRIIIYFALICVAIYVMYAIFLLIKQPTNIFTVEEGELYQEETAVGYIIRDEVVVKGENYKNGMEQIKTEGEKAAKDEAIFRYYSKNEEELKEKIEKLDVKIQEVMETQRRRISIRYKIIGRAT